MMKNLYGLSIVIIAAILCYTPSYGQFENKWTFQVSAGAVSEANTDIRKLGTDIKSLGFGVAFDFGLQYNITRNISIVGLAKFASLKDNTSDFTYNNLGFSIAPKLRFLVDKKINPYVFAGGSINYLRISEPGTTLSSFPKFGYTLGGGLDLSLTNNLALFGQVGFNYIYWNKSGEILQLGTIFYQLGLNVSIGKSKSL